LQATIFLKQLHFTAARHGTELDVTAVVTNTATSSVAQGVHLGEQH
jgi:hypothetical protein